MENENEGGWIVFGKGDDCIAVPAAIGMQVIASMVTVNAGFGGRVTMSEGQVPMQVITSDAMTVMRVRHQMLGKAKAESDAASTVEMDKATTAMEIKMKQMEMIKKMEYQKKQAQYEAGALSPPPLRMKLSDKEPLNRRAIKSLMDPDEKF